MRKLLPRKPKIAIHVLGEGETEVAILKHIKATYARNTGISVNIDCAHGGSPESMVDLSVRNSVSIFKKRFIFLDTDKTWEQITKEKAEKNKIELIPAEPCGEGFLLSLLESNFNPKQHTSDQCKRIFERKYLNKTDKLDHRNYERLLPLKKMEEIRKSHEMLDKIICLMTEVSL